VGDRPVVVLSGSLGTTAAMWDPQLPALAALLTVVRPEHRGHGGRGGPDGPWTIADLGRDLIALLDAHNVERASFCGLSLGGMASMWVAAHHPERVDRLVLACTAAHLPPASAWHERAAAVRESGPLSLLDVLLGRWFTPGFVDDRPDLRDALAAMLASADADGYARCCEAIAGMDLRSDLARITAPTLVIAGADDPVTPPAMALELQQGIAGAELVVLAAASHLANLERPEAFTAAVIDHLVGPTLARGRAMRRAVLGDARVDRSEARANPFNAPFLELITRFAWGDVWTRPGLDRRTRSAITLAMLVALGRFEELALHLQGARRNGLTDDEISEVLLQAAVYCGVPAANQAFAVAIEALGLDGPPPPAPPV
jgi:3-oxoadipate enol-lactonase/4-carboxymuconolactone decarboxylase